MPIDRGSEMSPTPPPSPDFAQPDETLQAVSAVSLRLMAGAVQKRTLDQLRQTVQASPSEYPWQVVTQAVLAETVDPQRLVQQGLVAQRDWILRGGRETPGPSLGRRGKGFLARICAELIFFVVMSVVVVGALMLCKHKWPEVDIYRLLAWLQGLFASNR